MSVRTELHFDGDTLTVNREQDVEDIIERNKAIQNEPQRDDWKRHIASIPNVILEKWLNEEWSRGHPIMSIYGAEMEEVILRKLRSNEWQWLRATDKRF